MKTKFEFIKESIVPSLFIYVPLAILGFFWVYGINGGIEESASIVIVLTLVMWSFKINDEYNEYQIEELKKEIDKLKNKES